MRVLLIGDSILEGMKPYITAALGNLVPTSVVIEAVVGSRLRWWERDARIASKVREHRPDLTVLALGTNDVGEERNPESYGLLWSDAIADAGMFGSRVIVVGPFGAEGAIARWNILRSIRYDAINGMSLAVGLPRAGDGIHFTDQGYRSLAERLGRAVESVWRHLPQRSYVRDTMSPIGPLAIGGTLAGLIILAIEGW